MSETSRTCTECTKPPLGPDSVYFVDVLGIAKNLFRRLMALGVVLSLAPDGRLGFDAPAGSLGEDLVDDMRNYRDDLLTLVEQFHERAAIMQHDGGLSREAAERSALDDLSSVQGTVSSFARIDMEFSQFAQVNCFLPAAHYDSFSPPS